MRNSENAPTKAEDAVIQFLLVMLGSVYFYAAPSASKLLQHHRTVSSRIVLKSRYYVGALLAKSERGRSASSWSVVEVIVEVEIWSLTEFRLAI